MFYIEGVVNGILCYKTRPSGKWTEFTSEELTTRVTDLEDKVRRLNAENGIWD